MIARITSEGGTAILLGMLFLLLGSAATSAQSTETDSVDLSDYFVIADGPETTWSYRFGHAPVGFVDRYLEELKIFGGVKWHQRMRTYSNGNRDTVLYRRTDSGVYHIIPAANKATPSLTMPTFGRVGQTWTEADWTWDYTITEIGTTLQSKSMDFVDLLVIRATERRPAQGVPARSYDLYFARGVGMIATIVDSVAFIQIVDTDGLDEDLKEF